jgi:hypothetical protein
MGRSSRRCIRRWDGAILGLWTVGLATVFATARAQGIDGGAADGVEVLTRGPVHEAFAVPVVNDPRPGLVAPRTPPEAIEEMPPDQKPAGQASLWIPGYWSWDQDRADFIWISGIWREPPPGRQWAPGYWNPVVGGARWIPGAWIPVGADPAALDAGETVAEGQTAYLPEPPVSLEIGPNIPQPAGEVFWSPGCWFWRHGRYVWRAGFWAPLQPAWVWVPAHYVWTPGGCLFVEGYWDLPLVSRGVLFAPVYYARPVYLRPAYVYTPTITIAAPGLVANLFVQPAYHHYCFGDYYDRSFLTAGVFPWFSFSYASGPRPVAYYDPLFTFYASVNVRSNPRWAAHCREEYVLRRDNVAMRPARTYIEQTRVVQNNINITRDTTIINNNNININNGGRPGLGRGPAAMIGRPIEQVAMQRLDADMPRLERIDATARREWRDRSRQVADFRLQRAGREIEAAPRPGVGAQARPRPFGMSASPVAAPHAGRPAGPTRRPEHVATPAAAEAPRPFNAGPYRPVPNPRPERRETPIARGPAATAAPRDIERMSPDNRPRRQTAPAVVAPPALEKRDPAASLARNRPVPNVAAPLPLERVGPRPSAQPRPQAARPVAPRPMREGPAAGFSAMRGPAPNQSEGQRPGMRRPPSAPRPMGPAARRATAAAGEARPESNP